MAQMQTISIRIPDEDFHWLLSLQEAGTRTPSEKLRALLARTRQRESGLADPEWCSAWMRELARPLVDSIAALERREKSHSGLISAVADWAPPLMATLASSRLSSEQAGEEAIEIEAILAQQSFRLLAAILRTAVTTTPSTYDKKVFERYLPDILELASIISTRNTGKEPNHG